MKATTNDACGLQNKISARQSCISLKDPDYLVFNYTKMMLGALYLQPEPDKILIIGLGGGTLPSTLSRILPKAKIDTVEIDPAVVRVAQKYFNFRITPAATVSEEDGRVFVKRAIRKGMKYDLIMLDAFDHDYIPEHLLTQGVSQRSKKGYDAGRCACGQYVVGKPTLRPRVRNV